MASSMSPLMRTASCRLSLPRAPHPSRKTSRRNSRIVPESEYESTLETVPLTRRPHAAYWTEPRTSFINDPNHDRTSLTSVPESWSNVYRPVSNHSENHEDAQRQTVQGLDTGAKNCNSSSQGNSLHGWSLAAITIAVLLASFTTQLDESIIATPLPTIASQFHSLGDVGWYGSAYYLPQAVLHPLLGQIYVRWRIKHVYLIALIVFEVGSVLTATAPSSQSFILGRVISGVGSAGVISGHLHIFAECYSERAQALMLNAVSGILVIGLTLGPLLGGIITQYVSWRWCFGINVPIGVFIATFIVLFLRIDDTTDARSKQRLMEKLAQLDLTGTALFSVTLIGLLFGCRLVQSRVPSWTAVGAIFASAAVVAIALAVQQYFTRTEGLLPVPIFRANAVWACCGLMLCLSAGLASHVSFLPLFFQVVFGLSPISSGVHTVPYVTFVFCGSIIVVLALQYVPYYNPIFISGTVMFAIASGLITSLGVKSSMAHVTGYQILAGFGFGLCVLCIVACPQSILKGRDVAHAQGIIQMFNILGGTFSNQITSVVFLYTLKSRLQGVLHLPADEVTMLLNDPKAPKAIRDPKQLSDIMEQYALSFQMAFRVSIVAAVLAFGFVCCLRWRKHLGNAGGPNDDRTALIEPTKGASCNSYPNVLIF